MAGERISTRWKEEAELGRETLAITRNLQEIAVLLSLRARMVGHRRFMLQRKRARVLCANLSVSKSLMRAPLLSGSRGEWPRSKYPRSQSRASICRPALIVRS